MIEHIPTSQMKRFCVRALPGDDLVAVGEHVAGCPACHRQFAETLRTLRAPSSFRRTLGREFWIRHEHVDYEQLIEIADGELDTIDRKILDIHLNTCAPCREDVSSFLAFRKEIEPELTVRYRPVVQPPGLRELSRWRGWRELLLKPAYAVAIVTLGIVVAVTVMVLRRRTADVEAIRTKPADSISVGSQTPTPDTPTAATNSSTRVGVPSKILSGPNVSPTPTAKRRETINQSANAEALFVLNDGRGTVSINRAGIVSGLDDVPAATRRVVAEAFVAEQINTPDIVKDLAGPRTLRGPSGDRAIISLSPARTAILDDRPSFEWGKLPGAASYQVYVGDAKGQEVAKSAELSPSETTWTSPSPLKRGEVYSWGVVAIVDGKEIFSPGPAVPEMKFRILSLKEVQELSQLVTTRSHLALGVFYARKGMVPEAEREFQTLVRENPHSKVAKKLLKQIQAWQIH